MNDKPVTGRVRLLLGRASVDSVTAIHPVVSSISPEDPAPPASAELPGEALQVLTLAQRTAEEYVAAANRTAQTVREEAEKSAEHCRAEAREYAERMRAEADALLTAARAEAERIIADGNETAEQLAQRAQRRYEDAVGGLAVKRKALQEQIETLEVFDAEYRRRLMAFLQGQLRALWADQPQPVEFPSVELQLPGGPS
ncbi:hypothetical protein Aab01nite_21600 [Paractinoplanes abujensis]|uniref:F0F1-type ATP synthase membrane subunit b/b n=1 Tax=Paractinoplanes abujensis TaxID=882441 RepID=A0A7W7CYH4_9ACTN|nr:hypothetical protein [Actinoplanes abujensis]MBB4696958.1 F0F1-type ATP synthase membrane subunit b/b' [Actinoplanes abujensis]GID18570.1 hypothetical protein Aab01nite_21600 [Actinoplanes abujensis]